MSMNDRAVEILVAHQRRDSESCICGWSELGRSHPAHQVAMLELELAHMVKDAEARGFNRGYHLVKVLLDKAEEDMNT